MTAWSRASTATQRGRQGETIVDVMPATLVHATLPAYKRDKALLLLPTSL